MEYYENKNFDYSPDNGFHYLGTGSATVSSQRFGK
jgi:hypothetical protein